MRHHRRVVAAVVAIGLLSLAPLASTLAQGRKVTGVVEGSGVPVAGAHVL